jgi:hypothetical protein
VTNNAEQKYGPHTAEVEAIIERVRSIEKSTFYGLREQGIGMECETMVNSTAWRDARQSATSYQTLLLRDVSYAVTSVSDANDSYGKWRTEAFNPHSWECSRIITMTLGACFAQIAKDEITPEQYKTLVAPWEKVLGPITVVARSAPPRPDTRMGL